ncbi:hypothetical protein M758_2G208500 [Ceratodon purpureus]|nr:hypothetical protein M758_2G208500 [Ceratodon purpureus]
MSHRVAAAMAFIMLQLRQLFPSSSSRSQLNSSCTPPRRGQVSSFEMRSTSS